MQGALPPGVTGIDMIAPFPNVVVSSPNKVASLDPASTFTIVQVVPP